MDRDTGFPFGERVCGDRGGKGAEKKWDGAEHRDRLLLRCRSSHSLHKFMLALGAGQALECPDYDVSRSTASCSAIFSQVWYPMSFRSAINLARSRSFGGNSQMDRHGACGFSGQNGGNAFRNIPLKFAFALCLIILLMNQGAPFGTFNPDGEFFI